MLLAYLTFASFIAAAPYTLSRKRVRRLTRVTKGLVIAAGGLAAIGAGYYARDKIRDKFGAAQVAAVG
jgi:hypothetical protein